MKVEQIPSFLHITVHKSAHVKAPFSGRYNTGDPLPQIVSNKTKYKKMFNYQVITIFMHLSHTIALCS